MGDEREKADGDVGAGGPPPWYERCRSWLLEHRRATGLVTGLVVLVACLTAFTDVAGFLGLGDPAGPRPTRRTTSLPPTAPRPTGATTDTARASSWTQRLAPNGSYDLDVVGGRGAAGAGSDDLGYRAAGTLASPESGRARLGRGSGGAGSRGKGAECPANGRYREQVLPVGKLTVGYVFCVRTGEGRHARVEVVGVDQNGKSPPTLRIRVRVREGARR